MKDKAPEKPFDLEKLGELIEGINLSNETETPEAESNLTNTVEKCNVKDDVDDLVEDLSNLNCLDGLTSLRRGKKTASKKDEEEECKEPEIPSEHEVLRKRGPSKGNKTPLHSTSPYNSSFRPRSATTHLFCAGGSVVSSSESSSFTDPSHWVFPLIPDQTPLIPDFSQLLDTTSDSNQTSENQSTPVNTNNILLQEEDVPYDIIDSVIRDCELTTNDLPVLPVTDDFLGVLDPESVGNIFEMVDLEILTKEPDQQSNADDPFSPVSTDAGYVSDSQYNTSCSNSPFSDLMGSPLSSISSSPPLSIPSPNASPRTSTPSPQVSTIPRKKRNKYFNNLDDNECDKWRRAILKKANEKDKNGLSRKDEKNRTMLHLAIEKKHEVYAVVLLNMVQNSFKNGKGTPPGFSDLPSYLNQVDDFGYTPILLSCLFNQTRVLEYLLDLGASPFLPKKFSNGNILHYVCERGAPFLDVAKIICSRASQCVNSVNAKNETPLHTVVGYHGMLHKDDNTGTTVKINNIPLLELLLDNNARLCAQDYLSRTPLHWMIITRNLDLVEILYSRSRDWREAVNLQNFDGRTILHGAAHFTDLELVKQVDLVKNLVVRYADTRVKDRCGKCPKDLVCEARREHLDVFLSGYFSEDRGWQAGQGLFQ